MLILVLLLGPTLLLGSTNDEKLYNTAITRGQEKNQYIFLVFTSNNCSWCDKLKSETFTDPSVEPILLQYVIVEINVSKYGPTLFNRFKTAYKNHPFSKTWTDQVPVYFLINPNFYQSVGQGVGYKTPSELSSWFRLIKSEGFAR